MKPIEGSSPDEQAGPSSSSGADKDEEIVLTKKPKEKQIPSDQTEEEVRKEKSNKATPKNKVLSILKEDLKSSKKGDNKEVLLLGDQSSSLVSSSKPTLYNPDLPVFQGRCEQAANLLRQDFQELSRQSAQNSDRFFSLQKEWITDRNVEVEERLKLERDVKQHDILALRKSECKSRTK